MFTSDAAKENVKQLNVSKAGVPDKINPRVLKELSAVIAMPLYHFYYKSLNDGTFPLDWKLGRVSLIFKKGSKQKANNYSPMSPTFMPCKLLEQIIREEIMQHYSQIVNMVL